MKSKTKFKRAIINLAKKYCPEVYNEYLNTKDGCFMFSTKQEALSHSFMSFEMKILSRCELSSDDIKFMEGVIKAVEDIYDMHTFEWEGISYSFDKFTKPYIFLLIIKIFIDEMNDEKVQEYVKTTLKYYSM